ncbi:hypothetical protein BASA60_001579 [Batrachochytrium salamandrivorans]|nr:hypothetical protein BASA60_001579 [Batrachochytrium salamandrivorans]
MSTTRTTTSGPVSMSKKKPHKLSEIELLERDNLKMEERLREFRESMSRQKPSELCSPQKQESLWSGGDVSRGSLFQYATDVLVKKKASQKLARYSGVGHEADEKNKAIDRAYRDHHASIAHGNSVKIKSQQQQRDILLHEATSPLNAHPTPPQSERSHGASVIRRASQRLWQMDTLNEKQPTGCQEMGPIQASPTDNIVHIIPFDDTEYKPGENTLTLSNTCLSTPSSLSESNPLVLLPKGFPSAESHVQSTQIASKPRYRREYRPPVYMEQRQQQQQQSLEMMGIDQITHSQSETGIHQVNFQSQEELMVKLDGKHVSFKENMIQVQTYSDDHSQISESSNDNLSEKTHREIDLNTSLLNGAYNEQVARQEFLQALSDWRGGKSSSVEKTNQHQPHSASSCQPYSRLTSVESLGTSTTPVAPMTLEDRKLQIEAQLKNTSRASSHFDGMSYMERLLLAEMREQSKLPVGKLESHRLTDTPPVVRTGFQSTKVEISRYTEQADSVCESMGKPIDGDDSDEEGLDEEEISKRIKELQIRKANAQKNLKLVPQSTTYIVDDISYSDTKDVE